MCPAPAPGGSAPHVKRSVSVAVRAGSEILLVRRPDDDPELPGVWGLPAASLGEGEGWQAAVARAAREKLGIGVRVGRELNRGTQGRASYLLEMRLYEAEIVEGEPAVPQPHRGVTQYSAWRWGGLDELRPAAEQGSLCSRLALDAAR